MGWLRTLVVLACCLGVVGCSDDSPGPEPGPSPTGSVSTPSPSSSSSAPEPAPTEPALPGAAKEATERGARAFIAYYWDLINYAQVTGDVTALKRVSGPNCTRCRAGIDAIATVYRKGGRLTDPAYGVEEKSTTSLSVPGSDVIAFESKTEISNQAHRSIAADGSTETFQASTVLYVVDVLWTGTGWRLDVMERS